MNLRSIAFAVSSVVLGASILGACGSSDDGAAAGGSAGAKTSAGGGPGTAGSGGSAGATVIPPSFDNPSTQCIADANSACNLIERCRSNQASKIYGSLPACIGRQAGACELSILAPGSGQTDALRAACGTATEALTCATYDVNAQATIAGCEVPAGTGAPGSACAYSAQCASAFCAIGDNAICGTCGPIPVAGTDCTNAGCGQNGLHCVASADGTTSACVAPVADGGMCLRNGDCADTSYCVGNQPKNSVMGVCTPYIEMAGEACDATMGKDCDPVFAGLTCDATTKVCKAIALGTAGAICGVNTATKEFSGCTGGAVCTNGTCQAPVSEGSACDSANGPSCLPPAVCVASTPPGTAGTCVLKDPSTCK